MVKIKMLFLLFTFAFIFAACERKTDGTYTTTDTLVNKGNDTNTVVKKHDMEDDFVMKAASGGMMEVQLGKLAQQKGGSKEVKNFGQMMVTDHTKANNQLKQVAQKLNIVLPDSMMEDHRDKMNDLKDLKGKEFDEKYIDMMVDDHEDDVDLFKDAADNDTRGEVKTFAKNTLPVLQKHLDRAKQIKDNLDKKD